LLRRDYKKKDLTVFLTHPRPLIIINRPAFQGGSVWIFVVIQGRSGKGHSQCYNRAKNKLIKNNHINKVLLNLPAPNVGRMAMVEMRNCKDLKKDDLSIRE